MLEDLQRRSSNIWEAYREQRTANPDAIEMHQTFLDNARVRVAVDDKGAPIGLSAVIPTTRGLLRARWVDRRSGSHGSGVGKALFEDAIERASSYGAACLEVTARLAQAFYERVGFRGADAVRSGGAYAPRT